MQMDTQRSSGNYGSLVRIQLPRLPFSLIGRAVDFDSICRGSNPRRVTMKIKRERESKEVRRLRQLIRRRMTQKVKPSKKIYDRKKI